MAMNVLCYQVNSLKKNIFFINIRYEKTLKKQKVKKNTLSITQK